MSPVTGSVRQPSRCMLAPRLGMRGAERDRGRRRTCATGLAALACAIAPAVTASAASASILTASPYEYLGWGNPQPPPSVTAGSGVHDLTLAFILSHGRCNPAWDGARPLLGGPDQSAIESIRAAGGDVAVSFGGWSGKKLGSACRSASALAAAYQKVIDAYSLHAID